MEYYQVKKQNSASLCVGECLTAVVGLAVVWLLINIIALVLFIVFTIMIIAGIIYMATKWEDEKKRKRGRNILIAGCICLGIDVLFYLVFIGVFSGGI